MGNAVNLVSSSQGKTKQQQQQNKKQKKKRKIGLVSHWRVSVIR
jgi:hypothetical protein